MLGSESTCTRTRSCFGLDQAPPTAGRLWATTSPPCGPSGVVEAVAGDAGPLGLSAKLANSIDRSNALHKTYAPVDIEAVRSADAARLKGRRRMRAENETGAKVSKR